nr:hypothetical transcript [Hymenolepis microstoma]
MRKLILCLTLLVALIANVKACAKSDLEKAREETKETVNKMLHALYKLHPDRVNEKIQDFVDNIRQELAESLLRSAPEDTANQPE